MPDHENDFEIHQNFTLICPLLGPNRGQSLDFHKFESPFLKDAPTKFGWSQFSSFGEESLLMDGWWRTCRKWLL